MFWIYSWELLWRYSGLRSSNFCPRCPVERAVARSASCKPRACTTYIGWLWNSIFRFGGFLRWYCCHTRGSLSFLSSFFVLVFVDSQISPVWLAYCKRNCFSTVVVFQIFYGTYYFITRSRDVLWQNHFGNFLQRYPALCSCMLSAKKHVQMLCSLPLLK